MNELLARAIENMIIAGVLAIVFLPTIIAFYNKTHYRWLVALANIVALAILTDIVVWLQ